MGDLRDARAALTAALAGDDLTSAPGLDAIKALPALLVGPGYQWLDGSSNAGPGRFLRYQLEVDVVVNAADPVGARDDLDDVVDAVLARLPGGWRLDRGDPPRRVGARSGEVVALLAPLLVSTRLGTRRPRPGEPLDLEPLALDDLEPLEPLEPLDPVP